MEDLEAGLAEAEERLAGLEREAAGVEDRVTLAALADDVQESTRALMRRAALPVEINRARAAVVAAELAVVREHKRGAEEEVRKAEADEEYQALSARWFALSRPEKRKKGRLDACLRIATEKLRPLQERERELLAPWAAPAGRSSVRDGAFSAEEFSAIIKRLLEGTPVVEDERQLDLLGRLGPKDMFATAVVLAAGEARTVEEARDFLAAGKRAVEARQGFSVLPGGSA